MFYVLVIVFILLLLLMMIYDCSNIMRIRFISKINNTVIRVILSVLPIVALFVVFNYVNAIVIVYHLCCFCLLLNFIRVISRNKDKSFFAVAAIIITTIYLAVGAFQDYHIYKTTYDISTDKDVGGRFKIIQLSDTHVGTTFNGEGLYKHIDKISKEESDLVVVTGDFVDDDTTYDDMVKSCEALSLLHPKYGVYFIYGNHDKGYYDYRNFNDADLRIELTKNHVNILEDTVVEVNDKIYLVGRKDKTDTERKSIDELVSSLDKSKYIIELNHQPNDYDNESKAGVDLVLSGHTHGGQLFPFGIVGVLAHINDAYYGKEKRGNTEFIVNSGMSGWAMDFKTGTKSEYTIINIGNDNE